MADNSVALIDSLAAGLTPVRHRTAWRDGMAFAALAVVEVAVYLALRGMRPDMPVAMGHMAFWWKAVSLLVLAVIGVATTIAALDPARSPRRGLRSLAVAAAVAVAVGWGVDAAGGGSASLIARLDWRDGLDCIAFVIGCAAQTGDINTVSHPMRRMTLIHGIVSFAFNTALLALMVNVGAGLLS